MQFANIIIELTGAQPQVTLQKLNAANIPIYDVAFLSELTITFRIHLRDQAKVQKIAEKQGDHIRQLHASGLYFTAKHLLKRPVLVMLFLALFLSTVILPRYIFFFRVEGNSQVPSNLILEKITDCGLVFGAKRKEIRSEHIKNELLGRIPELSWAGITTHGCVATISVKERAVQQQGSREIPTAIVAVRDAVVRSCTVVKGNALCSPGQTVQAGQVLISGVTNCERAELITAPEGEIIGDTCREITLIYPTQRLAKREKTEAHRKIDILLGKNRINLWESRGLSGGSCDKIVKNYPLILFGRFYLPVSMEITVDFSTEMRPVTVLPEDQKRVARQYLQSQMIAGSIRDSLFSTMQTDDAAILYGSCYCTEMIGRAQTEELMKSENYREDRQR